MTHALSTTQELRGENRTLIIRPVYVHGLSNSGEHIKIHTVTDNISQGGCYLQCPQTLKLGSLVFTFIQLMNGTRLAARGKVVRVEKKEQGLSGLAVCFNQPRLIPAI